MKLNCLTCRSMKSYMSDSEREYDRENSSRKHSCVKVDRRFWSGNISAPSYQKMRSGFVKPIEKKVRTGHRRNRSEGIVAFAGSTEPRLVRSCGMRRDWSLEDLGQGEEKKGRKF